MDQSRPQPTDSRLVRSTIYETPFLKFLNHGSTHLCLYHCGGVLHIEGEEESFTKPRLLVLSGSKWIPPAQ